MRRDQELIQCADFDESESTAMLDALLNHLGLEMIRASGEGYVEYEIRQKEKRDE